MKTIPDPCCTDRFYELWSYWHFVRLNPFLNHVTVNEMSDNNGIDFQIIFKTRLLLLKLLSASACPCLKVMISTKGVDLSGYLISTFIFWKKKLSIRDSPRFNSFAFSWINFVLSSTKLQYWMYALSALLKVKRFKLTNFWNNNLALSGWIYSGLNMVQVFTMSKSKGHIA